MKRIILPLILLTMTSCFAEEAEVKTGDQIPVEIWNAAQEAKQQNNLHNLLRRLGVQGTATAGRLTTIEDALVKIAQATQTISNSEARIKALEEYVARVEKDAAEVNAVI